METLGHEARARFMYCKACRDSVVIRNLNGRALPPPLAMRVPDLWKPPLLVRSGCTVAGPRLVAGGGRRRDRDTRQGGEGSRRRGVEGHPCGRPSCLGQVRCVPSTAVQNVTFPLVLSLCSGVVADLAFLGASSRRGLALGCLWSETMCTLVL